MRVRFYPYWGKWKESIDLRQRITIYAARADPIFELLPLSDEAALVPLEVEMPEPS